MKLFKVLVLSLMVGFSLQGVDAQKKELVILHTNDTHSQIEPNPQTARSFADRGGVVRRAAAIDQQRKENKNVLLVDAGDFVQGTPYFNFFKGEAEVLLMNKMGYEAAIFGNHEFDNGVEPLAKSLALAEFPIISTNYDVTGTVLEPYVKKYHIVEKDGVKIGLIGVGIDPDGLIAKKNFEGIRFIDPVEAVNEYSAVLKNEGCDLIVVLSHVGYNEADTKGDRLIAKESTNVDLIVGGHTHTHLKDGVEVTNKDGKPVKIVQTGGRGYSLGKVVVELDKK